MGVDVENECEVIELTDEECKFMVENTIRLSGFTKEQLIAQDKEGRFENGLARRTWYAVADFLYRLEEK